MQNSNCYPNIYNENIKVPDVKIPDITRGKIKEAVQMSITREVYKDVEIIKIKIEIIALTDPAVTTTDTKNQTRTKTDKDKLKAGNKISSAFLFD